MMQVQRVLRWPAFLLVPTLRSADSAADRSAFVRQLPSYYGRVRLLVHSRSLPRRCCLLRCISQLLCRFSDAGNDEYPRAPEAGVRKAPRHEIAGDTLRRFVPRAQLWGFERRTCLVHAGARREVERLGRAKHAGAFALSAARPEKRGSSGNLLGERRIFARWRAFIRAATTKMTGIEGWRSDGHDHEVSILITGVGGLG
jgi:hypothetical protein